MFGWRYIIMYLKVNHILLTLFKYIAIDMINIKQQTILYLIHTCTYVLICQYPTILWLLLIEVCNSGIDKIDGYHGWIMCQAIWNSLVNIAVSSSFHVFIISRALMSANYSLRNAFTIVLRESPPCKTYGF